MRLEGTKVLLSGEFEGMSRAEVVAALEARGAVIANGIAMDVEVVFAGESPGADVDAAMELGVRVEDGASLKAVLSGAAPPPRVAASPAAGRPAPAAAAAASAAAPPRDSGGEKKFEKGASVRIIGGREGLGEVGEIFWWGDSKFGDGMRAGVTGADGTKYWVDEEHLAWPDAKVDEKVIEEAKAANVFGRGDRIRVKSGKGAGAEGTIFWWGDSKWGDGMRAGVETDDGEKLWIDAEHLEKVEAEAESDDIPF